MKVHVKITFNPFSANSTKWSNTLKQFVGNLLANCFSVFDHFLGLALKGLKVIFCHQQTKKQAGFEWNFLQPPIQVWTLKEFSLQNIYWIFFQTCISHRNGRKVSGVKITGRYIRESKNWICSFLLMPPNKTLPQAEENHPFHPNSIFWKSIFPQKKGGWIMELKKWPKLNLWGQ